MALENAIRRMIPNIHRTSAPDDILTVTKNVIEAGMDELDDVLKLYPEIHAPLELLVDIVRKVQATKLSQDYLRQRLCDHIHSIYNDIYLVGTTLRPAETFGYREMEDSPLRRRFASLTTELREIYSGTQSLVQDKRRWWGRRPRKSHADALRYMQEKISAAYEPFHVQDGVTVEALANEILEVLKNPHLNEFIRAMQDSEAHYQSARNERYRHFLPGTCEDVLRMLDAWATKPTARRVQKPVLILSGGIRTGKSTIAAEFCRRLDERGLLGASIFSFEYPYSLVEFGVTMAMQLAHLQPALRALIVSTAAQMQNTPSYPPYLPMDMENFCRVLVRKPLQTLPDTHRPIFIVVSVSETYEGIENSEGDDALRLLLSCALSTPHLRILITSRLDKPRFRNMIESPLLSPLVDVVPIASFSSACRNIGVFLDAWVSQQHDREDPESLQQYRTATSCIAELAHGWLWYAQTLANSLTDPRDLDDLIEAFMSSGEKPHTSCFHPPFYAKPLRITYDHILDMCRSELWVEPSLNCGHVDEAIQNFLVICCHIPDPEDNPDNIITPWFLSLLTGIDCSKIIDALHAHQSIILSESAILGPYSQLHLLHPAFRYVLIELFGSNVPNHLDRVMGLNPSVMEARLALGCIRVILSSLFPYDPYIFSLSPSRFAAYAQKNPPPVESNAHYLQRAFTYLREHAGVHIPMEMMKGTEEAASVNRFQELDTQMLDELYLWLCVVPALSPTPVVQSDSARNRKRANSAPSTLQTPPASSADNRSIHPYHTPFSTSWPTLHPSTPTTSANND